jgi:hypothetical protein
MKESSESENRFQTCWKSKAESRFKKALPNQNEPVEIGWGDDHDCHTVNLSPRTRRQRSY